MPFPILYNPNKTVPQEYGVFNRDNGLAIPATFIIDKSGVIRWKYVGGTYDRPAADVVIEALNAVDG